MSRKASNQAARQAARELRDAENDRTYWQRKLDKASTPISKATYERAVTRASTRADKATRNLK